MGHQASRQNRSFISRTWSMISNMWYMAWKQHWKVHRGRLKRWPWCTQIKQRYGMSVVQKAFSERYLICPDKCCKCTLRQCGIIAGSPVLSSVCRLKIRRWKKPKMNDCTKPKQQLLDILFRPNAIVIHYFSRNHKHLVFKFWKCILLWSKMCKHYSICCIPFI